MPSFLSVSEEFDVNQIRTSAPLYMNGFIDFAKRRHMLLKLMGDYGTIMYNSNELARIWQIRVREGSIHTHQNTTTKVFTEYDPFEQMQVGIRGYEGTDVMKERDWKTNRGKTSLIDLWDFKMKDQGKTMVKRIQEALYHDGDSTDYADGYQGFDTCLHCKNASNGGSAPTNADLFVLPKDSYGGHSTELGTFGGTWSNDIPTAQQFNHLTSNDWPLGNGSVEYDPTSPLLVNYEAEVLGSGSNLWKDNVQDCVRNVINVMNHRAAEELQELCFLLAADLYPAAESFYDSRFRIATPYAGGDMGFPERHSLAIDGAYLKSEYAVPAGTGYVLSPGHLEMFNLECMNMGSASVEEPMIDVFGPDWSPEFGAYLFRWTTFGNLRMQPKYMAKLAPLAFWTGQAA